MKKDAEAISFETKLYRPEGIGTSTFARCPFPVSGIFGSSGQIPVAGDINGVPFRGTLMPWGDGTHALTVDRRLREAAGAGPGDSVRIECRLDQEPRVVEAPAELAAVFSADAAARAAWGELPNSHRREYATWVSEAKKSATKASRAAKAAAMLREGKRLK
jgi:hypothetical protein